MSDELPALPDTRDPFELLGLTRDADERAIKRAYARLIKVYRPDRSPEQFARIHAAFELIRGGATADELPASAPTAAAPSPRDSDDPEQPYAELRSRLGHDPKAVHDLLMTRFEARLAHDRVDELVAELSDPAFREDAQDHVAVALPALRAIAALAWRPVDVTALRRGYGTLPRELALEPWLDRIDHELALTILWRRELGELFPRGARRRFEEALPPPLATWLGDACLMSAGRRDRVLDAMRDLLRDPADLLATCDRVAARALGLCQLLTHRLDQDAAGREATEPDREAIVAEVAALTRPMHGWVRSWMLIVAACAAAAGAGTQHPALIAIGAALLVAAVGAIAVQSQRRERIKIEQVRPGLAVVLARHRLSTSRLKAMLDGKIDLLSLGLQLVGDPGLTLLGVIAQLGAVEP